MEIMHLVKQHTCNNTAVIQYFAYSIFLIAGYPYLEILAYLRDLVGVDLIINADHFISGFHCAKLRRERRKLKRKRLKTLFSGSGANKKSSPNHRRAFPNKKEYCVSYF